MPVSRHASRFIAPPHLATFLLLTLNIALFAITLYQTGAPKPSNAVLLHDGAMYSSALARHEYWRLVAYGFLHATPVHLLGNMLCLVVWGGLLERRLGTTGFIIIYVTAMLLGAFLGDIILAKPYATVGASAATSGILGALLCLWILGKIDLTASFFITNIGLNIALTLMDARINWGAHLIGFTAGLIACAVFDLIERGLHRVMRCKFPEFIKIDLLLLVCAGAWLAWSTRFVSGSYPAAFAAIVVALILAAVKLIDVVLSLRRGLAIMVITLSLANAAAVILAGMLNAALITSACASRPAIPVGAIEAIVGTGCAAPTYAALIIGAAAFVLTPLLLLGPLRRGFGDVGFVGASLRAARARNDGL